MTVPLVLPPGRNGIQPSLALTYVAGPPGGWGTGWNLELGRIERSTERGVPSYTDQDTWIASVQGVRSELVSIGSGEYRAKDEDGSFFRFRYTAGTGWDAWDKNGTRYEFHRAQSDGGSRVFAWLLSRVEDVHRNYMTIESDYWGIVIKYTGRFPGELPPYTVRFIREYAALKPVISWRAGFPIKKPELPDSIEILHGTSPASESLIRVYNLSGSGNYVLKGIRISDDNYPFPRQLGPSVTFSYSGTKTSATQILNTPSLSGDHLWNIRWFQGDLFTENNSILLPDGRFIGGEGNGRRIDWSEMQTSAVGTWQGGNWTTSANGDLTVNAPADYAFYAWTYLYTAQPISFDVPFGGEKGYLFLNGQPQVDDQGQPIRRLYLRAGYNLLEVTGYNQKSPLNFHLNFALADQVQRMHSSLDQTFPQFTGDYNGDGRTDLGVYDSQAQRIQVKLGQSGSSFLPTDQAWLTGLTLGSSDQVILGNFNEDGTTDLGIFRPPDGSWQVFTSDGTRFIDRGIWLSNFGIGGNGTPLTGDFNGDGHTDVAFYRKDTGEMNVALGDGTRFTPAGSWIVAPGLANNPNDIAILPGDFNGDEMTDLCFINRHGTFVNPGTDPKAGSYWTALSNGTSFQPLTLWNKSWLAKGTQAVAADIDHDGRSDLAFYSRVHRSVYVDYSGDTWFNFYDKLQDIGPEALFQAADFDGNGRVDMGFFNPASGTSLFILIGGEIPHLLTQVNNGVGSQTRIKYVPSSQYDNTGGDAQPDMPFIIPTVSEVVIDDGIGHSYVETYGYEGGRYDFASREFRGFAKSFAFRPDGSTLTTAFHQGETLKGRPYLEQVKDTQARLLLETHSTWAVDLLGSGINFVKLASQETATYDGTETPRTTRAEYRYDSVGNVTQTKSLGEVSDPDDDRTEEVEYTLNLASWIMNRPGYARTLNAAAQIVAERWLFYDGSTQTTDPPIKGLLTKEEVWLNMGGPNPVTRYEYDFFGNRTKAIDPMGWATTTEYGFQKTLPTKITNPLGQIIQFTYDRTGNRLTETDPNGQVTSYTYDTLQRLIKTVRPKDTATLPTITYQYDLTQVPVKTVTKKRVRSGEPELYTAVTVYDGLGRVIQIKDDVQDPTKQVLSGQVIYNFRGQVLEQFLPYLVAKSETYTVPDFSQPKTVTLYDALGRVTLLTHPDGSTSSAAYDHWTVTTTDENGHRTVKGHDAYGRLRTVQEKIGPDTYTTTYTYDTLGNLVKTTNAKGNQALITYDTLGRKTAMDDPDMGHWEYTYDLAGNLTQQKDAKGQILTFTYDALNRLITKEAPGSSVMYTYDVGTNGIGRLGKVTDNSGSTEFLYDNLGREIKTVKAIGGSSFTVERTYDTLSRLATLTYPTEEVVRYTYSPQGPTQIALGQTTYVTGVTYTDTGQIAEVRFGNGATTAYSYDPNRLWLKQLVTSGPGGGLQDLTYTYDSTGNIKQIQDRIHSSSSQLFQYDDLNRLTQASGAYGTRVYRYDAIGNLLEKDGLTFTYGTGNPLDPKPHAVTAISDGRKLTYDANGNLLANGGRRFIYDAENQLAQSTREELEIQVWLRPGWNLLCLPVEPVDGRIETLFKDLTLGTDYDQISRYDAGENRFEHYVQSSAYRQFDALEYGKGYLIHVTKLGGISLMIRGKRPARSVVVQLKSPWTLIGTPAVVRTAPQEALAPLVQGTDYQHLVRYNSITQTWEYVPSDGTRPNFNEVQPGEGYYLRVLQDKTWTSPSQSGEDVQFVYDGNGGRVKKINASSTTTYLGSLYDHQTFADGQMTVETIYVFLGSNRITAKASDESPRFYHSDHLGSTSIVTNAQGEQVSASDYTPFGQTWIQTGVDLSHKFSGQRWDSEAGLYFYGARYYDPALGRFIQPDSLVPNPGDPQDLNRYTYAGNNPLNYVDPTGHFKLKNFLKSFIGGAASAVSAIFLGPALGPVFGGMLSSAIGGAITAGLYGGDIGQGALLGAKFGFGTGLLGAGIADAFGDVGRRIFDSGVVINSGLTASRHGGLDSFLGGIAGSGLVTGVASGFSYSNAPRAPPEPQGFWDTIWDIASFGYSLHQFRQDPGWGTGLGLFADSLALLAPGVPGGAGFIARSGDDLAKLGRSGKQARLRVLANNPNVSSADRGWIKQEINQINRGQRDSIRVPPGKNLAHRRGYEARKGYGYESSDLLDIDLHKLQHRYEGY